MDAPGRAWLVFPTAFAAMRLGNLTYEFPARIIVRAFAAGFGATVRSGHP